LPQSLFSLGCCCCLSDSKNIYGTTIVKYRYVSSPMWVKKTTCKPTSGKYHFILSPMWVEKNPFVNLQMCNIISFFLLHELKKPLVGLQMCNIIFSSLMCIEKLVASSQVYNIIFKIHVHELKKPCVGLKLCNIIYFLLLCELKKPLACL